MATFPQKGLRVSPFASKLAEEVTDSRTPLWSGYILWRLWWDLSRGSSGASTRDPTCYLDWGFLGLRLGLLLSVLPGMFLSGVPATASATLAISPKLNQAFCNSVTRESAVCCPVRAEPDNSWLQAASASQGPCLASTPEPDELRVEARPCVVQGSAWGSVWLCRVSTNSCLSVVHTCKYCVSGWLLPVILLQLLKDPKRRSVGIDLGGSGYLHSSASEERKRMFHCNAAWPRYALGRIASPF